MKVIIIFGHKRFASLDYYKTAKETALRFEGVISICNQHFRRDFLKVLGLFQNEIIDSKKVTNLCIT